MSGRSKAIISLLILISALLKAESPEEFPKGKAVEKVNCVGAPGFSYALYLPSAYTTEKTWPVLFCFDADAEGMVPLELFKNAAERYGYIIVSSNNSRSDDRTAPNFQAMLALYEDATSRFSLNKKRMHATGYSGGARVACEMAYHYAGQFAGVIGCAAGFPVGQDPSSDTPFAFFGTVGNLDFNYFEMRLLKPKLQSAGIPFKIRIFDGGHVWPPAEICTEAVEWMEIQAMKSGKREKDDALIHELFQKRLKKVEEQKSQGLLRDAAEEFQSIAADFASLQDVSAPSAEASRLYASDEVKEWEQEEARRDQIDSEFQRKISSVNRSIRNTSGRVPRMEDVLAFLQVPELKKKAKEAKSKDERLHAERLLTVVAIQNGGYLARSFQESGDYERLALVLSIAADIRSEDPYIWYVLARTEAHLGQKEKALESLRKAVDHGFKDIERLQNDSDLKSLREEKQFKNILKRLTKNS